MKLLAFVTLAVVSAFAAPLIPIGSRVFIAPMDGNLDGFIAAEIVKQKIPENCHRRKRC